MSKELSRRDFLKMVGGSAAAMTLSRPFAVGSETSSATRPNIIMIYADDLDFDEIGVYDHVKFPSYTGAKELGHFSNQAWGPFYRDPRMFTPNIDGLARDGVMFSRFYITTSICTPSRYSVLSGRFASRSPGLCRKYKPGTHANIQWNTPLDPAESNVARMLKACGYATGMIGKWHNGAAGSKARGIPKDADPYGPDIADKMRTAYEKGVAHIRENLGFDFVERVYFGNKEELGIPDSMKVHNLEWFTEGALKFIDQNRRSPFFLYMPLTIPHGSYGSRWLNANPLATPAGMLKEAPKVQPSRKSILERLKARGIDPRNAPATWLDDSVGAILKKLDDLGIADNTVLIFSSDHQSRGKYTCYEACRVPFIVRWPDRIKPGTQIDSICANIDLAPTFVDLAGGAIPSDTVIDGRSFVPSLVGQATMENRRDALLLECSNTRAVVTENWKYIANRPPTEAREKMEAEARESARTGKKRRIAWDGRENWMERQPGVAYNADRDFPCYFDEDQLYNLEDDIYEQENLAYRAGYEAKLDEMKKRLKESMKTLPHTFGEFKTS